MRSDNPPFWKYCIDVPDYVIECSLFDGSIVQMSAKYGSKSYTKSLILKESQKLGMILNDKHSTQAEIKFYAALEKWNKEINNG